MPEGTTNTEVTNDNTPSVEELMERIAQAEARVKDAEERASQAEKDSKKYKNANDELSKENAERKRKERQSMSEEGQKLADAEERAKKAEERLLEIEKEMSRTKGLATYKDLSEDNKVVENFFEAVSDNDHDFVMKFITDLIKATKEETRKETLAEVQKNQPQTNAGSSNAGDGLTKAEQLVERTRKPNVKQGNSSIISNYL